MSEEEALEKATSSALRYLSYRPRSEAEVRTNLQRRYSRQVVEAVVGWLRERELLDDVAFAQAWSQSRASHRPRSAALVRRELLAKGVTPEAARAATEALDDEESAYRAGLRAAPSLAGADYTTFRRRMWGYLYRRGFSQAVIRRTTRRLWEGRDLV